MPVQFDVAVVGGGPAGSTVALCLARRGWKVCLLEATAFDCERYGETLPPEINPLLRELAVADEFFSLGPLPSPGIVTVWGGIPQELDYLCNPHGTGWHVDRNRFDAMLCRQAVAAGAVCFERSRADRIERSAEWWHLEQIDARVLVDAGGRNGLRLPDAQNCERETEDRLLAIVARLTQPGGDLRTFIESAPAGWWYSAPLPQGETIAMFFTDCDLYAREGIVLGEQLAGTPLTRERLDAGAVVATRTLYVPSSCRKQIAGDGWLAVGDSASAFDPLSGMGICKALRQGTNAAIAVDGYLRGDPRLFPEYAALVRAEWTSYVRRRRARYDAETRWGGQEFWVKRRSPVPYA